MTFYEHFWSKPSARPSCNECWIQKIQQQIMCLCARTALSPTCSNMADREVSCE